MINDPSKGFDADHCPFLGDKGNAWRLARLQFDVSVPLKG